MSASDQTESFWWSRFHMKRRATIIAVKCIVLFGIGAIVYRLVYPPAPDLADDGYAMASFEFREYDESLPALTTTTSDPAVMRALARALAAGKHDVDCRCIDLAKVTLVKPDGLRFTFRVMPAHGPNDCQISVGEHRYTVDRTAFLSAVSPLGLPAARWTGPP